MRHRKRVHSIGAKRDIVVKRCAACCKIAWISSIFLAGLDIPRKRGGFISHVGLLDCCLLDYS